MEKYLQELVAMPTISSDKDANNTALDYIQDHLTQRGLYIKRFDFNGYGALVATTRKDAHDPKVLLAAHLDVVPGPAKLFQLTSDETKFYGRGTFDMKFAIAAYMQTIDNLESDITKYDIGVMITTEEELGGMDGVKQLVNDEGYRPKVVILPDGAADWKIETLAKGFIYGHINVRGRAAHGSMPWNGDSATFKLLDLLQELKSFFAGQTLNTNTLNISMLTGGDAMNQIPAHASASIDVRFLSNSECERIESFIEELCIKYDGEYSKEPLEGHPCINDLSRPLVAAFAESVKNITGTTSGEIMSCGASDARYFAGVDVPAVICRPSGGGQHADSEWIDKKGCLQYPDVLVDYLNKIAKI